MAGQGQRTRAAEARLAALLVGVLAAHGGAEGGSGVTELAAALRNQPAAQVLEVRVLAEEPGR